MNFRIQQPGEEQLKAESALADALRGGGDTLPAWNAVWDLVQSTDSQAKQEVLETLRSYLDTAAPGETRDYAQQFSDAIESSFRQPALRDGAVLPSKEVRDQGQHDQIEAHREAMRNLGVRPGEGLPMWSMYMTRRNKRSWG